MIQFKNTPRSETCFEGETEKTFLHEKMTH